MIFCLFILRFLGLSCYGSFVITIFFSDKWKINKDDRSNHDIMKCLIKRDVHDCGQLAL